MVDLEAFAKSEREKQIIKAEFNWKTEHPFEYAELFKAGVEWADNHPLIKDDEYIVLGWPEIQEYMESPRWKEVGFDADKNLWFVPKDMVYKKLQ